MNVDGDFLLQTQGLRKAILAVQDMLLKTDLMSLVNGPKDANDARELIKMMRSEAENILDAMHTFEQEVTHMRTD